MPAKLLDGNVLAQKLKDSLKSGVLELQKKTGRVPKLVNIMIGDDPGSRAYAGSQKKIAEYIGIQYELVTLSLDVSQKELVGIIDKFNHDSGVDGIMIHQPVPSHIDERTAANHVSLTKDIEGVNATNIGKMVLGETSIVPSTPAAVMEHLNSTGISLRGKETVVVGRSDIVGKPLIFLLLAQNTTVTVCHSATEANRLKDHVGRAEILIVAVGKPAFIKGDWIKPGAVVVDVGINRVGTQIVGDVEFEKAKAKASWITPVPGGVGPVTVVMLMRNVTEAFKNHKIKK